MNELTLSKKLSTIKAFILVGGLGTRLRSIVSDVPKPMAPIKNKPFLYYKLQQIKNSGIKNIVFCAGYLSGIIEEYFKEGKKLGINIEYSVEKKKLGTAGAIKHAKRFIKDDFIVMNGDVYIDIDFKKMVRDHVVREAEYTISLINMPENIAGGVVTVDSDQKISRFLEKPNQATIKSIKSPFLNTGVYIFSQNILKLIPDNRKCSMEREIFPLILKSKQGIHSHIHDGYFIDIGVPENYLKFIRDMESGIVS